MPPLRFPPDRIVVEDRTVPLPPPPPYPDLAVSDIYANVNHGARTVCFGAIVRNYGGAAPGRPWEVDISVVYPGGNSVAMFVIPAEQIIGPDGFRTPCNEEVLVYIEDNASARYRIEVVVDPNHELPDLNRSNNKRLVDVWYHDPATLAKYRFAKWDLTVDPPRLVDSEPVA